MFGETLQPAGHRGNGHEGRGREEQGEDQGEDHDLRRLGVGRRQPDEGEPPAQRIGEQQDQQHSAQEQCDVGPDAEAHGVPDGGDQRDHEDVADHVRAGAAGQDGRSAHRKGTETLDQTLVQVLGEPDGRAHGAEDDRLHEDARHQELDVVAARDVDGPAEDVGEEQHEHDGLQRGEEECLGRPGECEEVAPRHRARRPTRPTTGDCPDSAG